MRPRALRAANRARPQAVDVMTRNWTVEVIADDPLRALIGWPSGTGDMAYCPASPPGVIGGAIIRAARRSARLSTRRLARSLGVDLATARSWQNGTSPLFCLPHGQLRQLAAALRDAGAQVGQDLGELLLAAQCDLLITGMLRGFEDYAEVPPIDEESPEADAARALLSWALAGTVPERFRSYVRATPLMSRPDAGRFAALTQDLMAGDGGLGLISFGVVLVALTQL
jgi:DNA-binding transcriptional regulator YiaG